jgi:phytoene synthase
MGKPSGPPGNGFLEELRANDRDRYLVTLLSGASGREHLPALAMFNLELARATELAREPAIGLIRLQWWRDSIEEAGAGARPRAHPVLEALSPLLGRRPEIVPLLLGMIQAREADLEPDPPPDLATFRRLADQGAGNLLRASILAAGPEPSLDGLDPGLARVASAYAIIGRLRSARHDAAAERRRLPADWLRDAGLAAPEFIVGLQGKTTPGFQSRLTQAVGRLAGEAERDLQAAAGVRWPKPATPVLLTGRWPASISAGSGVTASIFLTNGPSHAPWDIWRLAWSRIWGAARGIG